MQQPASNAVQWVLIVGAFVGGIALCAWLVSSGMWYFAVALVAASIFMGAQAARDGKPLYPGAPERRS